MACIERCIARVDDGLSPLHCVPNALAPPGVWQSRLSDTAGLPGGPSRCVYTHACWCLAAGDVAARVPGNTEAARVLDCCCGGVVGCAVCAYCMLWGVTRTRLRHAYNIPGSSVVDHIIVTLFPTCYLTQALNHLDIVRPFFFCSALGLPFKFHFSHAAPAAQHNSRLARRAGRGPQRV
jgi:Cys-rich protein (TIGR01571 family)